MPFQGRVRAIAFLGGAPKRVTFSGKDAPPLSKVWLPTVGGWKPPLLGLRRITPSSELCCLSAWRGIHSAFVATGFIPFVKASRLCVKQPNKVCSEMPSGYDSFTHVRPGLSSEAIDYRGYLPSAQRRDAPVTGWLIEYD